MSLQDFMAKIALPAAAQSIIVRTRLSLPWWQKALSANPSKFQDRLLANPELALAVLTDLAAEDSAYYPAHGLSPQVYYDSYRDLTLWAQDHYAKTGTWGITEVPWLMRTLQHRLVRLGRLQFEPLTAPADHHLLSLSDTWLNVHIPADGPLLPAECTASFDQANTYFQRDWFCCHSWLLSPDLQQLLPARSHILEFQRRFTIVAYFPNDRQAEERIFGAPLADPAKYPETTSLQRAAKQYLLRSRKIGTALGVFQYAQ